jgi:ankyrin repeat protein
MPLRWAALSGHEAIAKLLLEKGADLSVQNNDEASLLFAEKNEHNAIVKLLRQYS